MSYNKTLYFILFYFLGGGRRGEGGGEGGRVGHEERERD